MPAGVVAELITRLGGRFSRELGIELSEGREPEIFKWFLASFLYGARISTTIAARTYREFQRQGVLTPQKIQDAGWDRLVQILDAGGYVRYDFSTATRLLAVSADLMSRYDGCLTNVHAAATDSTDLERRLMAIGKGVGPVTVNIFLRELRGVWPKAQPLLSDPALLAGRCLGLVSGKSRVAGSALEAIRRSWKATPARGYAFADFEAALVRLGLGYCRKAKHDVCPMAAWCPSVAQSRGLR